MEGDEIVFLPETNDADKVAEGISKSGRRWMIKPKYLKHVKKRIH